MVPRAAALDAARRVAAFLTERQKKLIWGYECDKNVYKKSITRILQKKQAMG